MGICLNPGNRSFQMSLNSAIYIDKSSLISYINSVVNTAQRFVCVSRPRRFGKSVKAEMLAAYYGKGSDSGRQFERLSIAGDDTYREYLNPYNVIFLNILRFCAMKQALQKVLIWLIWKRPKTGCIRNPQKAIQGKSCWRGSIMTGKTKISRTAV
jgi:hypothetical protein